MYTGIHRNTTTNTNTNTKKKANNSFFIDILIQRRRIQVIFSREKFEIISSYSFKLSQNN